MKNFYKLIWIIAVIGFVVVSCGDWFGDGDKDGDNSNSSGNNTGGNSGGNTGGNTGDNNPGPMNPQGANVYFKNSSLPVTGINADVFMAIEGDDFEMVLPTPIGTITDGKLSFTLPNVSAYADKGSSITEDLSYLNRPAGDIKTETGEGWTSTSTVTKNTMEVAIPQDTKILEGRFGFVHEGKEYWLYYENETTGAWITYLNKPGTLKGEFNTTDVRTYTNNGNVETETYNYNETWNCTFTAGWNVVYSTYTTDIYSTNPLANAATMRWIAYNYN